MELSLKTGNSLKPWTVFTKKSILDDHPGSEYASGLVINSKRKSKYYENIKYKTNGCRENMKSVYKNYLILL